MSGFDDYLQSQHKLEQDMKTMDVFKPADLFAEDYAKEELSDINQVHREMERERLEKQQNKGFGDPGESGIMSLSYVEESIKLKQANSTFEERTKFYFSDSKYLDAKAQRYRKMAQDSDGSMDAFAKKHKNRSAGKRKDKATAAANWFETTQVLQKELDEQGESLSAKDTYFYRNQIMRARLEGMINAAKAKSTSKKDEKFRIARAKFSCLSTLYDQINNLQTEEDAKYFEKEKAKLDREISKARDEMAKYEVTPDEKWKETQVDPQEMLKNSGNPDATIEGAQIAVLLNQVSQEFKRSEYVDAQKNINSTIKAQKAEYEEAKKTKDEKLIAQKKPYLAANVNSSDIIGYRRDEIIFPTYIVRRDANGNPINKEEKKKAEWNSKWLKVVQDPEQADERRNMLRESFDRFKKMEFPSPEEINKKGLANIIKEDPVKVYSIMQFSLRWDNIRPLDPEFFDNSLAFDRELKAKVDAAFGITCAYQHVLGNEMNMDQGNYYALKKGDKKKDEDPDEREENIRQANQNYKEFLEDYAQKYALIKPVTDAAETSEKLHGCSKALSYEKMQESAKDVGMRSPLTEDEYKVYATFANTNEQLGCPIYVRAFSQVEKKLGGSSMDISRILGPVLKQVHFDEKWQPVSKEDKEAHEWNIKLLATLNINQLGPSLTVQEEGELAKANKRRKVVYKSEVKLANKEDTKGTYTDGDGNIREAWYDAEAEKWYVKTTDEEYNKIAVVKKINESKEKTTKELQEIVMARYDEVFGQDIIELPTPEQLEKDIMEPLQKNEPVSCRALDKFLANRDLYARIASAVLAYEGPLDHLDFAKEIKDEIDKKYAKRAETLRNYANLADSYCSLKYRVKPNTGANANLTEMGRMLAMGGGAGFQIFIDDYKKSYYADKGAN